MLNAKMKMQNHFKFELGGLPFLAVTIGMLICLLTMAPVSAHARRIHIPGIDPPGGTPPDSPEAGLKVALIAWWVSRKLRVVLDSL